MKKDKSNLPAFWNINMATKGKLCLEFDDPCVVCRSLLNTQENAYLIKILYKYFDEINDKINWVYHGLLF